MEIQGEPTDDIRLDLLSRVWNDDGMLDWFHAWAYGRHIKGVADELGQLVGFYDDDEDSPMTEGWDDDQRDLADDSGISAPSAMAATAPSTSQPTSTARSRKWATTLNSYTRTPRADAPFSS